MSEEFAVHLGGFQPGTLLAGYRLEAQVGAGGMAVVFRARDERLSRPVALKIMAPALAADKAYQRRFIAESLAAARVDDPHIIPIYEAGESGGVLFIAMRFVQGGDLGHVLEREGVLSADRAAGFISQVASALDAAHSAGLVHRDVKPANVLVDARAGRPDHVYLSDFGASKNAVSASVSVTGTGMYLGTPYYSAPEQIDGLAIDGRTDQYALGCVTYQLLTGTVPFERDQPTAVLLAHLSAPPPSLVARRPDLPDAVDQVVAKAMAKIPELRFDSCGDFADALRESLGLAPYHARGGAPAPVQPSPPVTAPSDVLPVAGAATQTAGPQSAPSPTAAVAPVATVHPATEAAMPAPSAATVDSVPGEVLVPTPDLPVGEADEDAGVLASIEADSQPQADLDIGAGSGEPGQEASVATPEAPEITAEAPGVVTAVPDAGEVAAEAAQVPQAVAEAPGVVTAAPDAGEVAADAPEWSADALDGSAGDQRKRPRPGSGGDGVPKDRRRRRAPARRPSSPPEMPSAPAAAARAAATSPVSVPAAAAADVAEVSAAVLVAGPDRPEGAAEEAGVLTPTATVVTDEDVPSAAVEADRQSTAEAVTEEPAEEASGPGKASVAIAEVPDLAPEAVSDATEVSADARKVPQAPADAPEPDAGYDVLTVGVLAQAGREPATGPARLAGGLVDAPDAVAGVPVPDTAARVRGRRLALVALVCAVLGAAGVIPFVTRSPAKAPTSAKSPPASAPRFSRVALDLPSGYESGPISSLAFSPSNGTLAIAGRLQNGGGLCLWDLATSGCTSGLVSAWSVAFSPDGQTLAAADDTSGDNPADGTIRLWNVASGKQAVTFTDPSSLGAYSVVFSPDGKTVATGDANGHVYLWNAATGKLAAVLTDPASKGVNSVAFSPDGKTLATGDLNGRAYLWNAATGKPVATLADPHGKGALSVVFSPDGKTLATGDANGHVYLWNAATGKLAAVLTDPASKGVNSVAFSPDGKTIASGDANGCTYVWDVATRKQWRAPLIDPGSGGINSVAFSPNGKMLATADEHGDVYIW